MHLALWFERQGASSVSPPFLGRYADCCALSLPCRRSLFSNRYVGAPTSVNWLLREIPVTAGFAPLRPVPNL